MVDLSKYKKKPSGRGKLRIDSSKISITDINKLKSIPIVPFIEEGTENDFYIEPIVIEYYIPKESRFAYETKYLYVELYDPVPLNDNQKLVMGYFKERNEPIDVIGVMNHFPQFLMDILSSYNLNMDLHEKASMEYTLGLSGEAPIAIRRALYLNEVLRKKEPKLASLEIIGDYTTYNINWCIRFLNKNHITHTLEDKTVEYMIKLHRLKMEAENRAIDERFEILTSIYMDQAFPYDNDFFDEEDEEF
jgi:hypothetical protein